MDVMQWTVLQLMTDTAIQEQARDTIELEEYLIVQRQQLAEQAN